MYFEFDWYFCWIAIPISVAVITIGFLLKILGFEKVLPSDLDGKHVLVCGGSSGIGKSIAIEASKLGADVTIVARNIVNLEATICEVQRHCVRASQNIRSISLDVSKNYDFIKETLHNIEDEYGPVFMLINCAGMAICGLLEDMSMEDIHYLIQLNFLGNIHTIKALLSRMKSRREGHIVITASQAALIGIYGLSAYSSTKFALRGLAESLHMEVLPYNIHVTLALPPDTDTPGFENENKSKPLATHLISETGGLYKPETVGAQIIKDALRGKFFSTVGFDNQLLVALCSGMSPVKSILDVLKQVYWIIITKEWNFMTISL